MTDVDIDGGHVLYADETTAGREVEEFRSMRRVVIAARCFANDEFGWLRKLLHEHFPDSKEGKSEMFVLKAQSDKQFRDTLLDGINSATIAIIDLAEHTKQIFSGLIETSGLGTSGMRSVVRFLKTGHLPENLSKQILLFARHRALDNSAVQDIERLLESVGMEAGAPLATRGDRLFDNEIISNLRPDDFWKLIARFSLALGDAIDPGVQAGAILRVVEGVRYGDPYAAMAVECLKVAVRPDRVFDQGSGQVFSLVKEANDFVLDSLSSWQAAHFTPGKLLEDDSRKVLGIQAADIAAGYARWLFEQQGGDSLSGASAVRKVFRRVLLNKTWIP